MNNCLSRLLDKPYLNNLYRLYCNTNNINKNVTINNIIIINHTMIFT